MEGPQTLWFLSCRGRVGASGCPEGWADLAAGPGGAGSHGVEEKKGVSGTDACQGSTGCCWAVARGQPGVEALGPPPTPGCLRWLTGLGPAWLGYSWEQPHALVGAARSTSPAWPSKSRRSGPGRAPTVKSTQRADSSRASNANQPRFPGAARPVPVQSVLVDARERQDLSRAQGACRRVKRGSRAGAPALAGPASDAGARDGQASAIRLKGVEPQAPPRTWLARWRTWGLCLSGKLMPLLCSRPTGSPEVPKRPWPHRAWSRCPPFPARP